MATNHDVYWVVGGLYTDTDFKTLATGEKLEEYGPFNSYDKAYDEWRARTWQRVDEAGCRYQILVDFEFECSSELMADIKAAAKKAGMTIDAYVSYVLEQRVEKYKEDHPFTRKDFMEISD